MKAIIFSIILISVVAFSDAQVPIPKRWDGFTFGSPTAPIKLEVFIDLLCSDSAAFWPGIEEVASHYGPDKVAIVVHQFPLPYHRNAFLASMALTVVDSMDSKQTWNFIGTIFKEQRPWLDNQAANKTVDTIIAEIGKVVVEGRLGMNYNEYWTRMKTSTYNLQTRRQWKWVAGHGIYGTPSVMINGAETIVPQYTWSLNNWKPFLDPLLLP